MNDVGSTPVRCALYARVSTKDKGQDTENQLSQLRQFCAAQGWHIVGEYVDQASGKSGDRVNFKRLFEDARLRKFDQVLFWSLDRFSREGVLETLKYLETLSSYGVNWRSYTEQYLDSCGIFKDAVLAILAVVAKQERVRLSERVRAGLDKARRDGKRLGQKPRVFDRSKLREMIEAGEGYREAARALHISVGVAHAAMKQIMEQPGYEPLTPRKPRALRGRRAPKVDVPETAFPSLPPRQRRGIARHLSTIKQEEA